MSFVQYDPARQKGVSVIESLRAGIPTRLSTRELPDLRPSLTELVRTDLERFIKKCLPVPGHLIWGQYGQGKTHALTTIEHLALDMGFAVSRVTLSREVSLHNFLNFYRRIASNIRFPNSRIPGLLGPLSRMRRGDLPRTLIQKNDRYSHPLPAIVLEDLLEVYGEEQDKLYSFLMGINSPIAELRRIHRESRHEAMPPFQRRFRRSVDSVALMNLLADVTRFCGFNGWVILIDEVELVGRLGKVSRVKAYLNLTEMLQWDKVPAYPFYTVGAVASDLQDNQWYLAGPKQGDTEILPEAARNSFDDEASKRLTRFFSRAMEDGHCPTIRPVGKEDLVRLLERVRDFHGIAYSWQPRLDVQEVIVKIGEKPIRTHIRATLETLDLQLLTGEHSVPVADQLVEGKLEEDESFLAVDEIEEEPDEK